MTRQIKTILASVLAISGLYIHAYWFYCMPEFHTLYNDPIVNPWWAFPTWIVFWFSGLGGIAWLMAFLIKI